LSLEEKRATIDSFLKVTKESADKNAKGLKKSVGNLQAKLKTFADSFGSFAGTRLALDPTQISKFNDEVKLAAKVIEGLRGQIALWMVSRTLNIFASLSDGLFPGFAFSTAVTGVQSVTGEIATIDQYKYLKQIYHWQAWSDGYATKVAELANREPTIQKGQKDLVTVRGSTIPEVCAAMGSLEDVWRIIKTQWESVSLVLKAAGGDVKVKQEPACKAYIETKQSIYGPIGRAMVKYGALQPTTKGDGFSMETHVPTRLLD